MKDKWRAKDGSWRDLTLSWPIGYWKGSSFSTTWSHVGRPYLDVLAEEVGVETQPVSGDVEAALQEDVSEKSTGVH